MKVWSGEWSGLMVKVYWMQIRLVSGIFIRFFINSIWKSLFFLASGMDTQASDENALNTCQMVPNVAVPAAPAAPGTPVAPIADLYQSNWQPQQTELQALPQQQQACP